MATVSDPVRIVLLTQAALDQIVAELSGGGDSPALNAEVLAQLSGAAGIDPYPAAAAAANGVSLAEVLRYIQEVQAAKIDGLAALGLAGVANSLAYRVHEIERHVHGRERWFGKLAVQTATDWADDTLAPYRAISGADAYGSDANDEALVIGTADTPAMAGNVRFDLHRIMIVNASSQTTYKLRLVYGTGTMAAAIAAGQYSELVVMMDPAAAQVPHDVFTLMMPRGTCGSTQVWIQARNASNNATIDFLVGLHEYEG